MLYSQRFGLCGTRPLPAEALPATTRINGCDRRFLCDRQEILVARDQEVRGPLDRRGERPLIVGIAHRNARHQKPARVSETS